MRTTFYPPAPGGVCPALLGRDCIKLATVRPDWRMPDPPPGGPWVATVVDTGDGWCPCWELADYDTEGATGENLIVGDDGWPFVQDYACANDWKDLGFRVE